MPAAAPRKSSVSGNYGTLSGWSSSGADCSSATSRDAAARPGRHGSAVRKRFDRRRVSFDVLCASTPDEKAAMEEWRALRPGGAAIINTAAMEMLKGSSILGERFTGIRRELRDKLEAAGFRVKRITHTNAALFPIMASVRPAAHARPQDGDDNRGTSVPPAPVSATLRRPRNRSGARERRSGHAGR
jgi:hypothetical protein